MAGAGIFACGVIVPSICLASIGAEFSLDLASRGFLASVRQACLLGALLLCGWLAHRYGKGLFLSTGMVLVAIGMGCLALAPDHATVLVAQAIVGLGCGALEALVAALVAELHPRSPAGPLNVVNGMYSVGLVVAALTTGEMLHAGCLWRATPWPWVLPALAVAALFATRGYPAAHSSDAVDGAMAFLRRPLFWVLMVAMALGGGCEAGLTVWCTNFMEEELGATARMGALTTAFFGAFMAVGRFGSSAIVRRVTPPLLVAGSALACAGASAGLSFAHGAVAAWALFGLGGLFVACFWPTLLAIAVERVQAGSTAMIALLSAAGIGGCMVFPWAIGALGDRFGLRGGLLVLPVSLLALAALAAAMWRRGSRPASLSLPR